MRVEIESAGEALWKSGLCATADRWRLYRIAGVLNDTERALLRRVRDFTEGAIEPVIEEYWGRDEFPFNAP
jgi:hypothetical protein